MEVCWACALLTASQGRRGVLPRPVPGSMAPLPWSPMAAQLRNTCLESPFPRAPLPSSPEFAPICAPFPWHGAGQGHQVSIAKSCGYSAGHQQVTSHLVIARSCLKHFLGLVLRHTFFWCPSSLCSCPSSFSPNPYSFAFLTCAPHWAQHLRHL